MSSPPPQKPTSQSSSSPSPEPDDPTTTIQAFTPIPPAASQPPPSGGSGGEPVVALYALFPATPAELLAISRACHGDLIADGSWGGASGATNNIFHPAPDPMLPLDDDADDETRIERVVAHHRNVILRSPGWRRFFDSEHMVVARTAAWRTEGVVVVTVGREWLRTVGDGGVAYRRGWDAWGFRVEAVGSVVVNLQICNMGWTEFTTWEDVQPDGRETDGRRGDMLENMLEGECGEEKRRWAEGLVEEFEGRGGLVE